MAKRKIKIAVVQFNPEFLNPNRNLRLMGRFVAKLPKNCELVVFPELATSGYNFRSRSQLHEVAEEGLGGPTARFLAKISNHRKIAIVAGFPEKARNGKVFNSALIVRGKKIDVYRKMHLFNTEKKYFSPGTKKPRVFTWKGFRFGVMICFDWFFPEVARCLALQKADLIAHPSNLVLPYAPEGMKIRSLENLVFSATANRVGTEFGLRFIGKSQILGRKGNVLGRMSGRKIGNLTIAIDPSEARNKKLTRFNEVFKDRKLTS